MAERAAPPWFETLTLRSVASLAMMTPEGVLDLPYGFAPGSPTLDGEGTFRASLELRGRPEATVTVAPSRGGGAQFEHRCTCGRWGLCPHAVASLVALALSDALREALVAGAPTAPALAALPALREAVRRALAADRITAQWIPLDAPSPPRAPPEYAVALPPYEPGERSLQSRVASGEGRSWSVAMRESDSRTVRSGYTMASWPTRPMAPRTSSRSSGSSYAP